MKVIYDMDIDMREVTTGHTQLEKIMRREALYDRSALNDLMEDLTCSILGGYLSQVIIYGTVSCLNADPSTAAVQCIVQTSSALYAGVHAVTHIIFNSTTGRVVDSCWADFITRCVDYLLMVSTLPTAVITMIPTLTMEQLVAVLVQCVRMVVVRLRPTAIRTLGTEKGVSPSATDDGTVLLAGLDAVTSLLLRSSSKALLSLLDARHMVELLCTLHECIVMLNDSIMVMLQQHDTIISISESYHQDMLSSSFVGLKSSGKQHSYSKPLTPKRIATNSIITAPSIANPSDSMTNTTESFRDDYQHKGKRSELEAPYRGTMVLYFMYENRRYLDSLRCFVGSVLAFQSQPPSSPLVGIASTAASIEQLMMSVANSMSRGVVGLSSFSSLLLTTMINLTSLKDTYPPHLLLLYAVDFTSFMQGIVSQCLETTRREVSCCCIEEQLRAATVI